jgi:hypothetical protein
MPQLSRLFAALLSVLLFSCSLGEVRLSDQGELIQVSADAPPSSCRKIDEVSRALFSVHDSSYDSVLNELRNKTADLHGNFLQIEPAHALRRGWAYDCP